MRIIRFLFAVLIIISAIGVFAVQKQWERSSTEQSEDALLSVLRGQNKSLRLKLGDRLEQNRKLLESIVLTEQPTTQKDELVRLNEPGFPKTILGDAYFVRAAGFSLSKNMEKAFAELLRKKVSLSSYIEADHTYLILGHTIRGKNYLAVYKSEDFFSFLYSKEGVRDWVVNRDGTVLYHPIQRFIGLNIVNTKPISKALNELSNGLNSEDTVRFLGLEGKEVLASWSVWPELGFVLISDWPGVIPEGAGIGWPAYFLLLILLGGGVLLGTALRQRSILTVDQSNTASMLNTSELTMGEVDPETEFYLEELHDRLSEANKQNQILQTQIRSMRVSKEQELEQDGYASWKLEAYEAFIKDIVPISTGKQVWFEFAKFVVRRSPAISVLVLRYAPSTFSLVPEHLETTTDLPDSAMAYLNDARIFVGNPSLIPTVLNTEAFKRWDTTRKKYMPLHQTDFVSYDVSIPSGGRACLLFFFDRRLNNQGELSSQLHFFKELVESATGFTLV
ncbi:MAG: hypothetical protein M9962_12820 [Oligoflexia bacterium]|nr:hypothetical protein [Oligoflexia bacterium]